MLHMLVPVAALLAPKSAAKTEVQPDCSVNTPVPHAKGITQPTDSASPWIADGSTYP